ncbi:hypothetical protein POF50_019400 [Streptomyces sp. SL13]|uniref:Uncharacterized protein n=1 Tax=Streptantibioticus silvisoli TaxID=2705255 RepID=A0AA90KA03_9ACTN|nr:hypothetical protein [Streptantibioticus silvisoli]MDI5971472.1 hypothetical protein [Streptantibioticus silvisoli]
MPLRNWHESQHYDHTGDKPCVCCGIPTPLRSERGRPVHKVCAETWTADHTRTEDNA